MRKEYQARLRVIWGTRGGWDHVWAGLGDEGGRGGEICSAGGAYAGKHWAGSTELRLGPGVGLVPQDICRVRRGRVGWSEQLSAGPN